MQDIRLKYLLDQYLAKSCTEAEKQELAIMILSPRYEEAVQDFLRQAWDNSTADTDIPREKADSIFNSILGSQDQSQDDAPKVIEFKPALVRRINTARRWAVAASIILLLAAGSYFLFFNKTAGQNDIAKTTVPIPQDVKAPETNRAMITLADGSIVALGSVENGMLAAQGNVKVMKTIDGKIIYNGSATKILYNTLTNPRGSRVIDMTLADGSRVWLNAGSSVTYPVAFLGNERKVSIEGEAYFEVAKDPSKKFLVAANGVTTEVLGTHFNVNSYTDEENIKVTLLEGSVKVTIDGASGLLKPGQQAQVAPSASSGEVKVVSGVEVEEVMAWKNGLFQFNAASLETIMRQVARWYDVEVVFEDKIADSDFGGTISRNVNVSQLLKMLESTGAVNFKIDGKKVIVIP